MIDNTTTILYINSMGGRSLLCNQITRELWVWCAQHGIWLSSVHIPGKQNVLADKESREKQPDWELKLNPQLFECIIPPWGTLSVDLFASRWDYQLRPFVSWRPEPEAMAIDAFSLNWKGQYFYAFPPFSLINRVLQKVEQDQSQGIPIVPMWTTQVWFPRLLRPLTDHPLILPKGSSTVTLPFNQDKVYHLQKALNSSGMQSIRKSLTSRGVAEKAAKAILQCWRGSTQKQYSTYLNKWLLCCSSSGLDPYQATPTQALEAQAEEAQALEAQATQAQVHTELCEQGLGYSAINTVRSALSQEVHIPSGVSFGELPIVKQFLKGVFQPALPRYTVIWDPSILLTYLKSLYPVKELSLKMLTYKNVALL